MPLNLRNACRIDRVSLALGFNTIPSPGDTSIETHLSRFSLDTSNSDRFPGADPWRPALIITLLTLIIPLRTPLGQLDPPVAQQG